MGRVSVALVLGELHVLQVVDLHNDLRVGGGEGHGGKDEGAKTRVSSGCGASVAGRQTR